MSSSQFKFDDVVVDAADCEVDAATVAAAVAAGFETVSVAPGDNDKSAGGDGGGVSGDVFEGGGSTAVVGDAVLFSATLWHRSPTNASARPRRAYYAQYSRRPVVTATAVGSGNIDGDGSGSGGGARAHVLSLAIPVGSSSEDGEGDD
jgi:hypothetical protein